MTDHWETVLVAYLEGTGVRADVESLRMRIHLPDEARQEIEETLRLADEITLAARSTPIPLEGPDAAVRRLRLASAPTLPPMWNPSSSAARESDSEQALIALVEDPSKLVGETDDEVHALAEELRHLGRISTPPAGAIDRLRKRLGEVSRNERAAVGLDLAERLLLPPQPHQAASQNRPPDVLAASAEADPVPPAKPLTKPEAPGS